MDLDGALELMERMLTHPQIKLQNLSVSLKESNVHLHAIEYMRHICQILLRRVQYPINLTLNGRSVRGMSPLSEQEKLKHTVNVPVSVFSQSHESYDTQHHFSSNEGILILVQTDNGPVWSIRSLPYFQITYSTITTMPECRKDGKALPFEEAIKFPMTELVIGTRSSVRTLTYTSLQCALTEGLNGLSTSDKLRMTCSKSNESFSFPLFSLTYEGFIQFPSTIYFFCLHGVRDCTISILDSRGDIHNVFSDCESVIIHASFNPLNVVIASSSNPSSWKHLNVNAYRSVTLSSSPRSFLPESKNLSSRYEAVSSALQSVGPVLFQSSVSSSKHAVLSEYLTNTLIPMYVLSLHDVTLNTNFNPPQGYPNLPSIFLYGFVMGGVVVIDGLEFVDLALLHQILEIVLHGRITQPSEIVMNPNFRLMVIQNTEFGEEVVPVDFMPFFRVIDSHSLPCSFPLYSDDEMIELMLCHFASREPQFLQTLLNTYKELRGAKESYKRSRVFLPRDIQRIAKLEEAVPEIRALDIVFGLPEHPGYPHLYAPTPNLKGDTVDSHQWTDVSSRLSECKQAGLHVLLAAETEYVARKYALAFSKPDDYIVEWIHCTSDLESFAKIRQLIGEVAKSEGQCILFNVDRLPLEAMRWLSQQLELISSRDPIFGTGEIAHVHIVATTSLSALDEIPSILRSCFVEVYLSKENKKNMIVSQDMLRTSVSGYSEISLDDSWMENMDMHMISEYCRLISFGKDHVNDSNKERIKYTLRGHQPLKFSRASEAENLRLNDLFYAVASNRVTVYWGRDRILLADFLSRMLDELTSIQSVSFSISSFTQFDDLMGKEKAGPLFNAVKDGQVAIFYESENMTKEFMEKLDVLEDPFATDIVHSEEKTSIHDSFRLVLLMCSDTAPQMPEYVCVTECKEISPSERSRGYYPIIQALENDPEANSNDIRCFKQLLVLEDQPQSTIEIGAAFYSAEPTRLQLFKRNMEMMKANMRLTEEEYVSGMSVMNGAIKVQPADRDPSLAQISIGHVSMVSSIPYALLSTEEQCVKEAVGRCVLTVWKHVDIPLLLCGPDWVTHRVASILMPIHRTISCSASLQESDLFGYWDTNRAEISERITASINSITPDHEVSRYFDALRTTNGRIYVPGLFIQSLIAGSSVLLTHVNSLSDTLLDQLMGLLDCRQHRDLIISAFESVFSGPELWDKVHVIATCESIEEAKSMKGFIVMCCGEPSKEVKRAHGLPEDADMQVEEKALKLQSVCSDTVAMVMAWEQGICKSELIQAWLEKKIDSGLIQQLFSSEIDQAVNGLIASCSFIRHPITVNLSLALLTAIQSGLPSLMITDSSCLVIDLLQAICQSRGFFAVYYAINSTTTPQDLFGSTMPGSLQTQWSRAQDGQKVIVLLTDVDQGSATVQNELNVWAEDLRRNQTRTLARCPSSCELICCCSNDRSILKDIKENCLVLRVPSLTENECRMECLRILSSCSTWTQDQEVPLLHLIHLSYVMFGEDSRRLTLLHAIRARELCATQAVVPLIAIWLTYVCGLDDLFRRTMEVLLGLNPDFHVRIRREGSRCLLSGHCDASVPVDCQPNFQEWSFTEGEARTAFKLTLALHGQRAILLYGPSPSGKTYVIQQTAAMWGHSVQRLWLTKKTLPSELSAMYQYAFANHQWILLENIQDASESTLKAMLPLLVLNASSDCRVMLTVSSASLADIPEVIRASVLLLYCSSIASLSAVQVICQLREEPLPASSFGPFQASNVPACLRVMNTGSEEAYIAEFGSKPEHHKVQELQLERRVEYDLVRLLEGLEDAEDYDCLRRGREVVLRVCTCTPAALDRNTLNEILTRVKHAVQGHFLEYVIERLSVLVVQTQTTSRLVYRLQSHPNASFLRKWSLLPTFDPSLRPSASLKMLDQNEKLDSIFRLSKDDPAWLELAWMLEKDDWLLESVHMELRGLFVSGLNYLSKCATSEDVQGAAMALWSLQKAYLDAIEVKKHLDEASIEKGDYKRANQGYETVSDTITQLPEEIQQSQEVMNVRTLLNEVLERMQQWQKEEERKAEESAYAEMLRSLEEQEMNKLYEEIKENSHQKNKVKPQATDNTIVKEFLPRGKGESGFDSDIFEAVTSKAAQLVRALTTEGTFASRQPYKRLNVIIDTNVTMRGTKRRLRSIITSILLCLLRELGITSSSPVVV